MFGSLGNDEKHSPANSNHKLQEMNGGDIEDIMNKESHTSIRSGPRPMVCSYASDKENILEIVCDKTSESLLQEDDGRRQLNPLSSLTQNLTSAYSIDRKVDYQGWLDAKKRKWKENREKKKRRR